MNSQCRQVSSTHPPLRPEPVSSVFNSQICVTAGEEVVGQGRGEWSHGRPGRIRRRRRGVVTPCKTSRRPGRPTLDTLGTSARTSHI